MPSFLQHNLCLVVLGRRLLVVVMKFQEKFASLRQLNSPNSRDKFHMLYQHVFDKISGKLRSILLVFVNFAGFCRFTRISWHRDRPKYQKPWYYELHHLHYTNWWLKICIWRLYFYSWSRDKLRTFLILSPVTVITTTTELIMKDKITEMALKD